MNRDSSRCAVARFFFCDTAVKEMGQGAGVIVMPYGGTTLPVLAGK